MSASKQKFVLTVKCKMCTFQVTQEVEVEPENLIKVKTEMVQQAVFIHKKHSDLRNFEVY